MADTIEIPLSKTKIVVLIIGATVFVGLGLLFVIKPETFINPILRSPIAIAFVGYASVIFFGLCAVVGFRKLFDTKAGLIVDDKGLSDNSSGVSTGFIPWGDISDINSIEISGQKLIMIIVSNPEFYINKRTNYIAKKAASINHRMYGSPISLNAGTLKCNYDDLYRLLRDRWQNSRI